MSQASILEEAQDLLLNLGDPEFLALAFVDTVRHMARRCPVFSEVHMVSTSWVAGQWTDATQTYTDDSGDAQDTDANDFALSSTIDNDGHMIGAYGMFSQVVYTIGTADDGTATHEYTYHDGTLWRPLTLLTTPNFGATGTQALAFVPPEEWRQGTPLGITFPAGLDTSRFWIRVRATAAPGGLVGQDRIESASQAMFLTIPPQGNNQSDMHQAAGLFRIPGSGTPVQSALATQLQLTISLYPLPSNLVDVLTVLYYPNELEPAPVAEGLDLLTPTWRTATGTPTRYTQDLEPFPRVRLTPIPTVIGPTGIPIWTGISASGATVSADHLVFMTLQVPVETEFPPWFEGLVSYAVAAREARRLGETQDLALAQTLDGLVDGLVEMLKAMWDRDGLELTAPYMSPLRR